MADSRDCDADAVAAGIRAARALGDSSNYRGAIDALRRVLGRQPDSLEAHTLLGIYLHAAGRRADAVAACRAAVALDPNDADAHRSLGIALGAYVLKKGEGLKHLRHAVALAPHEGFNHYVLARALVGIAGPRQASKSFVEACERAPTEAVILAGTAEFLFKTYQVKQAQDFAARALAAGPDDVTALTAAARSRLVDGCAADARDLARAAVMINATHRPAVELLIEAEMCRNPYFAIWSRLKGWCLGGRWRSTVLLIVATEAALAVVVTIAVLVPRLSTASLVSFVAFVLLAVLPGFVLEWRVSAALKPMKLRRRF